MNTENGNGSVENQRTLRSFILGLAVATITRPSRRDQQQAPGPSDLANKCDLCVARKIAQSLGLGGHVERTFSLKAWLGTAVHEKLERDLKYIYPHARQEITVQIGDLPGIGMVEGHVDLFIEPKRTVVDWKTTDLDKLKKYRTSAGPAAYTLGLTAPERKELTQLKEMERADRLPESQVARLVDLMARTEEHSGGVPEEYMGQTMLYLRGLIAMGLPAEYAALVFIPRDSNKVDDIWVASCRYRPDVAQAVINRAVHLASLVRSGQLQSIQPHPECFPCVIWPRLRH